MRKNGVLGGVPCLAGAGTERQGYVRLLRKSCAIVAEKAAISVVSILAEHGSRGDPARYISEACCHEVENAEGGPVHGYVGNFCSEKTAPSESCAAQTTRSRAVKTGTWIAMLAKGAEPARGSNIGHAT